MTSVADANSILIAIALIVGLLIAWWIFKRSPRPVEDQRESERRAEPIAPPVADRSPAVARKVAVDGSEGGGITDQGAAAAADIAGHVLGVSVHQQLASGAGAPDDLAMMKGVGPKFVAKLHENGIIRFDQLARLSANEVDILDEKMGPFKGRLVRDRVIEQASHLARDDRDGFEAKFGKLGGA